MRARYLVGGVAVLALATAAGLAVGLPGLSGETEPAAAGPPETATVTRQSLADTETKSGTLGYGAEHTVGARSAGTVTWLAAEGAVIGRGKPCSASTTSRWCCCTGRCPRTGSCATGSRAPT
ncbi:hypothetical protein ACFQZ4_26130 [Catellatospora coxensis]